jgi:hypothetical protein
LKIKLIDIAEIIRSKNSGPFEITLDIIFKNKETFEKICTQKAINKELIANLYNISQEKVLKIVEFIPANAIKCTIERPIISGNLGDTDVYGAQQHAPLLEVEINLQ